MRCSPTFCSVLLVLLGLGSVGCAGPRSTPLARGGGATAGARSAPLTLHVRLPAAFNGSTLSATVYADGATVPASPSAVVGLSSGACPPGGGERLCTLSLTARVGLIDVAIRAANASGGLTLSGVAPRQVLPAGGASLSLALDGAPARWSFSPPTLVGPADGAEHELPFAVVAQDAQGYTLLAGAPQPPATIVTSGDVMRSLSIVAQGGGAFLARYDGYPLVQDVSLSASAPGAAKATGAFGSLVISPASFEIAAGGSATIGATLAHFQGSFAANTSGSNCTVSPASATPAVAGGTVSFSVHLLSGEACSLTLDAAPLSVPIVIPGKKAVARPGIGIGPSKIQHIVVMLQENRSFDNIFGGLDQNGNPFPGADTVSNPLPGEPTPHDHLGYPVPMSTGLLEECYDPDHDHPNSTTDVDGGKMDGFDKEPVTIDACSSKPSPAPTNYVYRTIEVSDSEVGPYWQMGEAYAISDRMFEPFSSASYGPHLYLVSGQSAHTIDNLSAGLWGCDNPPTQTGWTGYVQVIVDKGGGESGPGVGPCFNVESLADELDQRGVSWRFYAAPKTDFGYDWSAYDSFNDIRNGPDWSTHVITPPAQIITDVGNGTLAAMTWVTPMNATSDHPQSASNMGPAWITSVVNEIGQSKFWSSTAIFITWDDWGGWYDHVPPPVTGPVSLGVRVPVIVISPYVRPGYVSHVVHTTGSITHFAEEAFNLPSLGEDDARQDDFSDTFNFAQTPLTFAPFTQSRRSRAEVMRAASRPDGRRGTNKVGD